MLDYVARNRRCDRMIGKQGIVSRRKVDGVTEDRSGSTGHAVIQWAKRTETQSSCSRNLVDMKSVLLLASHV